MGPTRGSHHWAFPLRESPEHCFETTYVLSVQSDGVLPDEVLTHTFVFLSIKSMIICTLVSKWKSLIQNPTFISTHLHHSHNKNLLLFCLYPQIHKVSFVFHNEGDPHFTQHSNFYYPFHVSFCVVGTCDGLLCLSEDLHFISISERLCLRNPCVRKFVNLPSPSANYTRFLGFGFDPKTKDYRVVKFVISEDSFDLANPHLRSRFIHCPLVNGE